MTDCDSQAIPSAEELRRRTKEFALRVIKLFRTLPRTEEARVLGQQVLRSGAAVAAIYRSACWARSPADFVSKIRNAIEEADATALWLELIVDAQIIKKSKLESLIAEANELVRIFQATRTTARSH